MSIKIIVTTLKCVLLFVALKCALFPNAVAVLDTSAKQKRQLFRENVLPELGGKIPESAFQPERLALNRFNQKGLYSPDGIYLELREFNTMLYAQPFPNTIKITVNDDNLHVAPPGQYHSARLVDTTYLIRDPVMVTPIPHAQRFFPIAPYSSLKAFYYYKHKQSNGNNRNDNGRKIFFDFVPYLSKLHEYDR